MLLKLLMLEHFSSVLLNVGHWNLSVWGKDHFQLKGDNLCFTIFLMFLWDGVVSSTGANSAQVCCDIWCWRNNTADDLEGHTKAGELQTSMTLHPTASSLGRKWLQLDSLCCASLDKCLSSSKAFLTGTVQRKEINPPPCGMWFFFSRYYHLCLSTPTPQTLNMCYMSLGTHWLIYLCRVRQQNYNNKLQNIVQLEQKYKNSSCFFFFSARDII